MDFDLEQRFREKQPVLARRIPRLGYAVLRRVLRERFVRDLLARAGTRTGPEFVRFILSDFQMRVRVVGHAPAASDTRWTVCLNHPTGGWDGLAALDWLCRWAPDCRFLVNDVLWSIEGLRPVVVPVDVFAGSRRRLDRLAALYASPTPIALFPAGRTARPDASGRLIEMPWSKSFVRQSRKTGRGILPVHISGRNSVRFYRTWRWRERFGIAKAIEMFLLVDEMIRRRGAEIVLTVGTPQDARELSVTHGGDQAAADWLREYTQTLGQA